MAPAGKQAAYDVSILVNRKKDDSVRLERLFSSLGHLLICSARQGDFYHCQVGSSSKTGIEAADPSETIPQFEQFPQQAQQLYLDPREAIVSNSFKIHRRSDQYCSA